MCHSVGPQSILSEYVRWNGHDDEIRVDKVRLGWVGLTVGMLIIVVVCSCLCLYKIIRVDKNNNIEHFFY